jgi:hypothetical protein
MRFAQSISILITLGAVALGCGDSTGSTEVTLADLVGTWTADQFEFTNQANTAQRFDVVANGGSFEVTVAANGTITGSFDFIVDDGTIDGTISVGGGVITFINTDVVPPDTLSFGNFVLAEDVLTLTDTNQEFPFGMLTVPPDPTPLPASLAVVLNRQ